jgi:hypothetical protein
MFAVAFDIRRKTERWDDDFDRVASLKPRFEAINGFINVNRLAGGQIDRRPLSLPFRRDEAAVDARCEHGGHRAVPGSGLSEIVRDYRPRVGEIARKRFHCPEAGSFVWITSPSASIRRRQPDL